MTTKTREEWQADRINAIRAEIEAREAAVDAVTRQGISEYWIDTAQSRQKVTRADVSVQEAAIKALYQRLAELERAAMGSGATWGPAW